PRLPPSVPTRRSSDLSWTAPEVPQSTGRDSSTSATVSPPTRIPTRTAAGFAATWTSRSTTTKRRHREGYPVTKKERAAVVADLRSEEHTSELQSRENL